MLCNCCLCLFRLCVYLWSVLMCWSCSWMRQLCPEEWRWGKDFSFKEHFMLDVQQLTTCAWWWLCFVCILGPTPWDGFLLHVWLTGCCSASSSDSVSFHPINPWVCVYAHSYLVVSSGLSHLLSFGVCNVDSICNIHVLKMYVIYTCHLPLWI